MLQLQHDNYVISPTSLGQVAFERPGIVPDSPLTATAREAVCLRDRPPLPVYQQAPT